MSKHDQAAEIFRRHDGKESAVADAVLLYEQEHGDFDPANFEEWLTGQRQARDYLFIDQAAVDLEELAFGQGNITARGRLARELGSPDLLDERARAWELRDARDYRRGTAPNSGSDKPADKGKPDRKNPYLWPPGPKRDAEIARIMDVLPTKAIRSLCANAECDIAGRPLRGRKIA